MESPDETSYPPATQILQPSVMRLWRQAAQRNLRNQWLKLVSYRTKWVSSSSNARSQATSLVNAYLSQKYMTSMELGVLEGMPDIRKKASYKLFAQKEGFRCKLLSSYKEMVGLVTNMVDTSRSMRCYDKGACGGSPIAQYSSRSADNSSDSGDGGGIPVYTFSPISSFEQLAEELVQNFVSELNLKRLLVVELLMITCEDQQAKGFCWSNELYPGEFDDFSMCKLYSTETGEPVLPRLMVGKSDMSSIQFKSEPSRKTLQVYLTTWLAEVNIDTHRVDEIFAMIGEEMHVNLS